MTGPEIAYVFIPPQRVVFARATGAYSCSARRAWDQLLAWAAARIPPDRLDIGIGVIRDDPRTTVENARRYDACLPVVEGLEADTEAGISVQTVRGGATAVYRHIGSHQRICDGFTYIRDQWMIGQGLAVDPHRPFLEIYLNDPRRTPVEQLQTDLCVPVKALGRCVPESKRLIAVAASVVPAKVA